MLAWKKAAGPKALQKRLDLEARSQNNERGQVMRLAAQTVGQPRPECRPAVARAPGREE